MTRRTAKASLLTLLRSTALPALLATVSIAGSGEARAQSEKGKSPCADAPEVRLYHWAWNAQMGLMFATQGKQATPESIMCKNGVNLRLVREDNTDNMQSALLAFAEELKSGTKHPKKGAHFVIIMGDGAGTFLNGVNGRLTRLGPDFRAQIVGVAGYSRGEDKFMGPEGWKKDPKSAKGGVVAGVLRDGDWNIAMKWLGDNQIKNNPNETTWDPDALNWIAASDYIDAAQKYVSGYCAELKNVTTQKPEKKCVEGVVTWTPGDVTIAEQKGGLVSIVSTYEYKSQMPAVIIGSKKWMEENRKLVTGMLSAIFDGSGKVKASPENLKKAAAVSAAVYAERDPDYWLRYFHLRDETDKQGKKVELGGSAVATLQDNLQVFGLVPGSQNIVAATYTIFADIVRAQYPEFLPTYPPADQVFDLTYLKELAPPKSK